MVSPTAPVPTKSKKSSFTIIGLFTDGFSTVFRRKVFRIVSIHNESGGETMNRRNLITITTILVLVVPYVAFADTTVPNTFTTGSVASAEEVNENFTALENGVNANATEIAVNAQAIGGFYLFTPIVMGVIASDGTVVNGYGNFTASRSAEGYYRITVTGKTYNGVNMLVLTQMLSGAHISLIGTANGDIGVETFTLSGVWSDTTFSIVIYEF
jgi:hypothetical protein